MAPWPDPLPLKAEIRLIQMAEPSRRGLGCCVHAVNVCCLEDCGKWGREEESRGWGRELP